MGNLVTLEKYILAYCVIQKCKHLHNKSIIAIIIISLTMLTLFG